MSDTILRKSPKILYHNHVKHFSETPIIFHKDLVCDLLPCQLNAHESVEFLFATEGEGLVELDGQIFPFKKDDLVICNTYVSHRVLCDTSIRYFCLIVEKRFYNDNGINFSKLYFKSLVRDPALIDFFLAINDEYEQNRQFKQTGLRATVLNLLLYVCRNYSVPKPENTFILNSGNTDSAIHKSIIYIKNNLQKPLSLDEIAEQAQISKYHFSRLFKETTGQTVFAYVNNLRCEFAKTLLSGENKSIQETAVLCGFKNISYFTKTFKAYTALTPSEFIKLNKS